MRKVLPLGLLIAACGAKTPPTAAPAAPEPQPSFEAGPRYEALSWVASPGEARARAADERKPLLVFVRASWSEPSVVMDQTVWQDSRVLREAPRFVALRIDLTHDRTTFPPELVKEYGIESVPTTLVVNVDGSVVARFGIGVAHAAEVAQAMREAK